MSIEQFLNQMGSGNISPEQRVELIKMMYNDLDKNVEFKTDLSTREISSLLQLDYIDDFAKEEWGIKLNYSKVGRSLMRKNVSKNRTGRKEWTDVMRSFLLDVLGQNRFTNRLLGRSG